MALPFSFRQPFKQLSDVKLNNDFGCLLVDLKLLDNFDAALKDVNTTFSNMKTSLLPFGVYYL